MSENASYNVYVTTVINGSVEFKVIVKEPFVSFESNAKETSGEAVPVEVRVPEVVFGQRLGTIVHAGIVRGVVSVM